MFCAATAINTFLRLGIRVIRPLGLLLFAGGFLLPLTATSQVPVSGFTATPISGCAPLVVNFSDASTGNPTAWLWDFGNGNTSTLKDPSVIYFTPGTYTVSLTVTNANGSNTLTRANYVVVNASPQVDFSANRLAGCFPLPVQFTDLSSSPNNNALVSWQWDLGNGTVSTVKNPFQRYTTTGSFTVTLRVTDDKGCSNTSVKTNYINVSPGVRAGFTNNTPTPCQLPATIQFINTSAGPGTLSYQWNFGNGNTSTQTSPSHTYTQPGFYNVTLVTTSSAGCVDTFRTVQAIEVGPNSSFTFNNDACIGTAVSFLNTSVPLPDSVRWQLGDGTSSTALNPVKNYAAAGSYTVQLISFYSGCSDTVVQTVRIRERPQIAFSANERVSCSAPFTVNFQDNSTGVTSWLWNFGNGSTSNVQQPVHTYTNPGSYTVTLTGSNEWGCTQTRQVPAFIVISKPRLTLQNLPAQACIPFTRPFTATVTPAVPVQSYLWDFGDGNTSTAPNPSHTYAVQGTYTVRLVAVFDNNCADTAIVTNAVRVGSKPTLGFTAAPLQSCAGSPILFTNTSTPAGSQFIWFFGDGGTSSQTNPTYQYIDTGFFDIQLIAINNGCGDTLTKEKLLYILPPVARFRDSVNCNNRQTYFFKDSSIGATAWRWDFGDGNTSTQQNPVHTYGSSGIYTVSLTVFNDTCSHEIRRDVRVAVPTESIGVSTQSACHSTPVTFSLLNANTAFISSYQWLFGDGNTASNLPVVNHAYDTAGLYTVQLVITNINGCRDTLSRTNPVTIRGPKAAFTAPDNNGCRNHLVTFNDASTSDGTNALSSWNWNFGDGTTRTYSAPPFEHRYLQPGTYSVRLIVTDASQCSDTLLVPNLVFISAPQAAFAASDTVVCPATAIQFSNISTGNGLGFSWNFGDGTTSQQGSPAHAYVNAGLYTVTLTAVDNLLCRDTLVRTQYIRVTNPVSAFTLSDTASACAPFLVEFENQSQFADSLLWDFGDGSTANLPAPAHSYNFPGMYRVSLTAFNNGGCSDTSYANIFVYDTAGLRIQLPPPINCVPVPVTLRVNTTNPYTYIWDLGDGTILSAISPTITHTYTNAGTFQPKLILTDPAGCQFILSSDRIITHDIRAGFTPGPDLFCDSGRVQFSNLSTASAPITFSNWNFGDGAAAGTFDATHVYRSAGNYTVSLTVESQAGCRDSFLLPNRVKVVNSPVADITGPAAICVNESARHTGILLRNDTATLRWNWTLANGAAATVQAPPPLAYTAAGNYTMQVIVTNGSGCADTVNRSFRVHPLPVITLPPSVVTQAGVPIVLPASFSTGIRSYSWTPAATLNCSGCPRPVADPPFTTLYRVNVVDSNTCVNSSTTEVVVLCNKSKIYIPNAFTPNNDGLNDRFMPSGIGYSVIRSMRIFNRWGELVYEQLNLPVTDRSKGWDGTQRGMPLPPGVYVYTIEIECEENNIELFRNTFSLIR